MASVRAVLQQQHHGCTHATCLLDGVPHPGFAGPLVATENFARVVRVLGLGTHASLSSLEAQGALFCSLPWATVAKVRSASTTTNAADMVFRSLPTDAWPRLCPCVPALPLTAAPVAEPRR